MKRVWVYAVLSLGLMGICTSNPVASRSWALAPDSIFDQEKDTGGQGNPPPSEFGRRQFLRDTLLGAAMMLGLAKPASTQDVATTLLGSVRDLLVQLTDDYHRQVMKALNKEDADALYERYRNELKLAVLRHLVDDPDFPVQWARSSRTNDALFYSFLPDYFWKHGLFFRVDQRLVPLGEGFDYVYQIRFGEIALKTPPVRVRTPYFDEMVREIRLGKNHVEQSGFLGLAYRRHHMGDPFIVYNIPALQTEFEELWNDMPRNEAWPLRQLARSAESTVTNIERSGKFLCHQAIKDRLLMGDKAVSAQKYFRLRMHILRIHEVFHIHDPFASRGFQDILRDAPLKAGMLAETRAYAAEMAYGPLPLFSLGELFRTSVNFGNPAHQKAAETILLRLSEIKKTSPEDWREREKRQDLARLAARFRTRTPILDEEEIRILGRDILDLSEAMAKQWLKERNIPLENFDLAPVPLTGGFVYPLAPQTGHSAIDASL